MANTAQARKRARSAEVRRIRNTAVASRYRTHVKNVLKALATGDNKAALSHFQAAVPIIDRAVSRGLIHRNKAARQISKLNARIKNL